MAIFMGTAWMGGDFGQGSVFRLTPEGDFTLLHSFSAAGPPTYLNDDGAQPLGGLVQGVDSGLYGVTSSGGTNNAGTVFRITTNGDFSIVHTLDQNADGIAPSASLFVGGGGVLYGTTEFGGPSGNGTGFFRDDQWSF